MLPTPLVRDALGALIVEIARARTAIAPAPPGRPYLGVEPVSPVTLDLAVHIVGHGIFRKYEQVLDVEGGLGAVARWAAARRGCEVVVTASDHATATAGALLTRRAHLEWQVRHVVTPSSTLPIQSGSCTHAWIVDVLPTLPDPGATMAEVFRSVRPGGLVAIQDLVGPVPDLIAGWNIATGDTRAATLTATGFVDLHVRDVTNDATERASTILGARAALQDRLDRSDDADLRAEGILRARVATALADGSLRVVQMFARRP